MTPKKWFSKIPEIINNIEISNEYISEKIANFIKNLPKNILENNKVFHINNDLKNIWFKIEKEDPSRGIYSKSYKMNIWYEELLHVIEFQNWEKVLSISDAVKLFATEDQIKEKIIYIINEIEKETQIEKSTKTKQDTKNSLSENINTVLWPSPYTELNPE